MFMCCYGLEMFSLELYEVICSRLDFGKVGNLKAEGKILAGILQENPAENPARAWPD